MTNQLSNEMLRRGEDFFAKKNFRLAKNIFQEFLHNDTDFFHHEELLEKIKICTEELNKGRAKVLLKKAKKLLKKKKNDQVLEVFKEAYELSGEEWIKQRINSLQGSQEQKNILSDAETAENQGDNAKAATLYEKIFKEQRQASSLLRMLFNLILTCENNEKVIATLNEYSGLLSDSGKFSDKELYEIGFVFLKVGNYAETLRFWQKLGLENPEFVKQKNALFLLREKQIYDKCRQSEDFFALLPELEEFSKLFKGKSTSKMFKKCRLKVAEQYCENKKYRAALNALLPFPEEMTLHDVLLYAKIYYQIALFEKDVEIDDYVNLFEFGLTAIFNPEISGDYYHNEEEFEEIEKKILIKLIKTDKKFTRFKSFYSFTRMVILKELKKVLPNKNKHLVLSPKVAWLMKKCSEISASIEKAFPNQPEKAYFSNFFDSDFQSSVYSVYSLRHEISRVDITHSRPKAKGDFTRLISLELAIAAFCEKDDTAFANFIKRSGGVLHSKDILQLFSRLIPPEALSVESSIAMETALAPLKKSPDAEIAEIINSYSLNRIRQQFHNDEVNPSILKQQLVKIFGENEIPEFYDDILEESEYEQMGKFFDKRKLMPAAEIAKNTDFIEVKEFFFEEMRNLIALCCQMEPEFLREMENKVYKHCHHVDPSHPLTREIADSLREGI